MGSFATQLLWTIRQLVDYYLAFEGVSIYCDNASAISQLKYIIHHSRVKHIYSKHHFICGHVKSGDY